VTRKRSPETELRYVRRELAAKEKLLASLSRELQLRTQVGQMMSNICFNLAQNEKYDPQHRQSMKDCREMWDQIKRAR